jgi:WD40 repeat protein
LLLVGRWGDALFGVTGHNAKDICLEGAATTPQHANKRSCPFVLFSSGRKKIAYFRLLGQLRVRVYALVIYNSFDLLRYVYSIDYGRVVDKVLAHDDAVSCVCLDKQAQQLLTGSWDGTAKLWQVLPSGIHKTPLLDLLDIEAEIKCLDLHSSQLAAFGASDGTVTFADLRLGKVVGNVSAHTAAVTGCQLSPDGTSVITCSKVLNTNSPR